MPTVRQQTTIAAPPDTVWPHVADPRLLAAWHPKLFSLERPATGTATAGERFLAAYEETTMSRRPRPAPDAFADHSELPLLEPVASGETRATIVTVGRVEPPTLVEYSHELEHDGVVRRATETYRLSPTGGGGTRVEQVVDLGNARLPWWAATLIWLISRVGKPVGRPDLELLAEAVESPIPASR